MTLKKRSIFNHSFSARKIISFALALAMLVGLLPAGAVFADEETHQGQARYFDENGGAVNGDGEDWVVKIQKEAAVATNEAGVPIPNEFDITLSVETKDKDIIKIREAKLDIVMALDLSGSMDYDNFYDEDNRTPNERWKQMKEAAKSFIGDLLPTSGERDTRVSIVGYAGGSYYDGGRGNHPVSGEYNKLQYKTISEWTNSAEAANGTYYDFAKAEELRGTDAYDPLYLFTDTNSQAGFYAADVMLKSARPDAFKYVIYMSDGLATSYYTKSEKGIGVPPITLPDVLNGDVYVTDTAVVGATEPADLIAVEQAGVMKENHPDAKLITVGLELEDGGKVLQTGDGNNPHVDKYYPADNNSIKEIYDEIASLIEFETKPWMVSDEMSDYVEYMGIAEGEKFADFASYSTASATLEWDVLRSYLAVADEGGDLGSYSLTYRVRLKGDAPDADWGPAGNVQAHETNGATTLTYFLQEDSGIWSPSNTVDFDVPTVNATLGRIIYKNDEGTLKGQSEFLGLVGYDTFLVKAPKATHKDGYEFVDWKPEGGEQSDGKYVIPPFFEVGDLVLVPIWKNKNYTDYEVLKEVITVNGDDWNPNDPDASVKIGDDIEYRVTVTNTGSQTMTITNVKDTLVDDLTPTEFDPQTLEPGDKSIAKYHYTVVAEDVIDDKVTNKVKVFVNDSDTPGGEDEVVLDIEDSAYTVVKTAVTVNDGPIPEGGVSIGDLIKYEVVVTNTGDLPIKITKVEDDLFGDLSFEDFDPQVVQSGGTSKATYEYRAAAGDVEDGKITNNVKVFVNDDDDDTPGGQDEEVVDVKDPGYSVEKTIVSPNPIPKEGVKIGDTIKYQVVLTNTGGIPLEITNVEDTLVDDVKFDITTVPAGKTATATYEYVVSADDVVDGKIKNNIKVYTNNNDDNPGEDETEVDVEDPAYTVEKTVTSAIPENGVKVGDTINYKVVVTNTGALAMTITDVEDTLVDVAIEDFDKTYLIPGETAVAEYSYTVTAADAEVGSVTNKVTVRTDGVDDPVEDEIVTPTEKFYTLTVNYKYADGAVAAPAYVDERALEGKAYSVVSPVIPGYYASYEVVEGAMPANDVTVDVIYTSSSGNVALTIYNRLLGYDGETLTSFDGSKTFDITLTSSEYTTSLSLEFDEVRTIEAPRGVYSVTVDISPVEGEDYIYRFVTLVTPQGLSSDFADENMGGGTLDISALATVNMTVVEQLVKEKIPEDPNNPVYGNDGSIIAQKYVHDNGLILGEDASALFDINVDGEHVTVDTTGTQLATEPVSETYPVAQGASYTFNVGAGAYDVTETLPASGRYALSGIFIAEDIADGNTNGSERVSVTLPNREPAEVASVVVFNRVVHRDSTIIYSNGNPEMGDLTGETSFTGEVGTSTGGITPPTPVAKPGYKFDGWDKELPPLYPEGGEVIHPMWSKDPSQWSTITFVNSSEVSGTLAGELVFEGIKGMSTAGVVIPTTTAAAGYRFLRWDAQVPVTYPNENLIITAYWEIEAPATSGPTAPPTQPTPTSIPNNNVPSGSSSGSSNIPPVEIEDEDLPLAGFVTEHVQYINGYWEGDVRPDMSISRAETATIIYRLLSAEDKSDPVANPFTDVPDNAWYTQSVTYLASVGIVVGYNDGTFHPNEFITRAEFAAMISRFDELEPEGGVRFSDVSERHWALEYINSAATKGWVTGYPDGTFLPDNELTRAEIVTVVNRMLDRSVEAEDVPEWAPTYTDLPASHWAYAEITEASIGHEYTRQDDGTEIWDGIIGEFEILPS